MRQPNTIGFGNQSKERTIAVETPRTARFNEVKTPLVVAIKELIGNSARCILIGEFQGLRAKPLRTDNSSDLARDYPSD